MANALYGKARQAFLTGGLNWSSMTAKLVLVDSADYTLDIDVHEFLSDIPAGARVATSGALQNKTSVLGVADADDILIAGVTGDRFEAVVLYSDTGTAGTSRLIAYWDSATGLPLTPNGGNVITTFNALGIFKL